MHFNEIKRNDFAKIISDDTGIELTSVKKILESFSKHIIYYSLQVTEDTGYKIKFAKGFSIDAAYGIKNKFFKGGKKPEVLLPSPTVRLGITHSYRRKLKELFNERKA